MRLRQEQRRAGASRRANLRLASVALRRRHGGSAGGVVTSDRGGISCTITVSGGVANRSGKCAQDYKTGTTVTLLGAPAGGGVLSSWTGCTGASENPLSCEVKL